MTTNLWNHIKTAHNHALSNGSDRSYSKVKLEPSSVAKVVVVRGTQFSRSFLSQLALHVSCSDE